MNCQNFEAIITELARGQMLEARARKDALAHMENCNYCASRFADEQVLTSGLREVAASAMLIETPAHIETALLSAFRQGAMSASSSLDAFDRVKTPRWSPWSIAAAATILVVSAFGLLQLFTTNAHDPFRQEARTAPSAPLSSPVIEEASVQTNPEERAAPGVEIRGQREVGSPTFSRDVERRRGLMHEAGMRGRQLPTMSGLGTAANANEEIATDFLPLTYGSDLSQLDEGQVVRVEVPRSVLQSFGLPINGELADGRVKADVLLGHDGVARAIRFIR